MAGPDLRLNPRRADSCRTPDFACRRSLHRLGGTRQLPFPRIATCPGKPSTPCVTQRVTLTAPPNRSNLATRSNGRPAVPTGLQSIFSIPVTTGGPRRVGASMERNRSLHGVRHLLARIDPGGRRSPGTLDGRARSCESTGSPRMCKAPVDWSGSSRNPWSRFRGCDRGRPRRTSDGVDDDPTRGT